MAAGPVLGTKVFTHLQEREGEGKKKKRTTQMRPMKRDRLDQQLVQGGSEGKPFHQVLEIQAAGS